MNAVDNHDWLSLGKECYVRASDVVGVFDLCFESRMHELRKTTEHLGMKAIVAMRDGRLVPCFVLARTLVERMVQAARPEVAVRDDLLAWRSEFCRDLTEWWKRFGTSNTRIVSLIIRATDLRTTRWDSMAEIRVESEPYAPSDFTDPSTKTPLAFKEWLSRAVTVEYAYALGVAHFGQKSLAQLRAAYAKEQEAIGA